MPSRAGPGLGLILPVKDVSNSSGGKLVLEEEGMVATLWCMYRGPPGFIAQGALSDFPLVIPQLLGELSLVCEKEKGVRGVSEQGVPQLHLVPPQPQSGCGHPDPVDLMEILQQIGQELPQGDILAGPQGEDGCICVGNNKEVVPQIPIIPSVLPSWTQKKGVCLIFTPKYLPSRGKPIDRMMSRQICFLGGCSHDNSGPRLGCGRGVRCGGRIWRGTSWF